MTPGSGGVTTQAMLGGFFLMQFGGLMWSIGSVEQRRMGTRVHPFVSGGVQQLATGIAFALPAVLDGRHEEWNTKGLLAIAYLAVFGGIVGYSAFIYSMHHLPVALVSIYTYINPIVAVALGWWFYREPFGWRETVAMVVIFAGVAIVKWTTRRSLRAGRRISPDRVALRRASRRRSAAGSGIRTTPASALVIPAAVWISFSASITSGRVLPACSRTAFASSGLVSIAANAVNSSVVIRKPKMPDIQPRCAPFAIDSRCPVLRL